MSNTIADGQGAYKPLWLSQFASLATILLAFFIAVCSTGIAKEGVRKFEQAKRSVQRSFGTTVKQSTSAGIIPSRRDDPRNRALQEAKNKLVNTDITIHEIPDGFTLTIPDNLVFNSGTTDINSSARYMLDKVSWFLNNGTHKVIIEGHTDNVPVSRVFLSNRELSLKRAIQVAHYLQVKSGIAAARIIPVGFGDTRPAESNATDKGREMNRRVVIKLYY